MNVLDCLEDDLLRYSTLHSWYKLDKNGVTQTVFPCLLYGQQPRNGILAQTNPEAENQLRWWFLDASESAEAIQTYLITDSENIYQIADAMGKNKVCISGDLSQPKDSIKYIQITARLRQACLQFYLETQHCYSKVQKAPPVPPQFKRFDLGQPPRSLLSTCTLHAAHVVAPFKSKFQSIVFKK
jgi:hypothetical protein